MDKTNPESQKRIESLVKLASKSPSELLVHVFDMQDKFDQATKTHKETVDKANELMTNFEKMKPVKGKDYMTPDEIEQIQNGAVAKVKMPELPDMDAVKTDILKTVEDNKKPEKQLDYEEIAKELAPMMDVPEYDDKPLDYEEIAKEIMPFLPKQEPSETGIDILQKIDAITPEERKEYPDLRLDKYFIPGYETFITQMALDYAISKLRNQVSFVINKLEDLTSTTPTPGGTLAAETPTGTIDGTNPDFHVDHLPIQFFWNGQYQNPNAGDYTYDSGTGIITMATPPSPGDNLVSYYQS